MSFFRSGWLLSLAGASVLVFGVSSSHAQRSFKPDPELVDRGRYLVKVTGCNDCHTAGYAINNGKVPERLWLLGDNFGWRGPWGTTYGSNLRLFVNPITEDQWVEAARTMVRRPPMPYFNLNAMHESDLRAMYHFIRSLGDPGKPAPAALPPDQEPTTPHALWVPGKASR